MTQKNVAEHGIQGKRLFFSRVCLVASPVALLIALGWFSVFRVSDVLTDAAVGVYQQTEMEIVRGVARGIEYSVSSKVQGSAPGSLDPDLMEQEMFRLFVDPVLLLKNGDAWIYAPDHVVYDQSSDFPKIYRGKSMAEIFAIQKTLGAFHYEEMTDAVMNARPGVGWYVWLPSKGREIAAWTSARAGPFVWTIGLSTPLPEILESTGVARQLRSTIAGVAFGSLTAMALLAVWILSERRRWRESQLTTAQKDLSMTLSSLHDLDQALGVCLQATRELSGVEAAGFFLNDPQTGKPSLRTSRGPAERLARAVADPARDPSTPSYMRERPAARGGRAGKLGVIPLSHGSSVVGYLGVDARGRTPFTRHQRKALEAVAALAAGVILRVRAEDSLRESEQRFRSVVDTAADAIVAVDAAGKVVFWNKGAERTFGRTASDALGMEFESVFAPLDGCETAAPSGQCPFLLRREGVRADGGRFPAEVSSARWAGSNGAFTTYIVRDGSERARAEQAREELEQKLQRAQRMESIGVLAGGVAHDLNNLLTPIVGYTDLLLQDVGEQSDLYEPLVTLRGVGERAGAVVQDLLTLGRKGSYQMSPVDLNEVVADFLASPALAEFRKKFPHVIVEHEPAPQMLSISGSLPHLFKTCLNLVQNACEAMPHGGVLTIGTALRHLGEPHIGYETIAPGAYAVLEFRDTGSGIEKKDLERIFEPFYTKKQMGRCGTGLGLAVVYGVVHDHGGWIDVRTELGKGTRIELWFPFTAATASAEQRKPFELRGTETVMLVEDQPEQRAVTRRLLERAGYVVVAVENGHAAIASLRKQPVDIMVLDMIMEESFDGLDCYREAIAIRPGQKAIIVSGYAETSRVVEAQRLGAGRFVRKPYRVNTLLQAVREELEKATQPAPRE